MSNLGYSREGDVVTLTLTLDQYNNVIMALGIAAGQASKDSDDRGPFHFWLRLANAINDGNPEWRPYAVPEEARTVAREALLEEAEKECVAIQRAMKEART